jgi:hypothetical protein
VVVKVHSQKMRTRLLESSKALVSVRQLRNLIFLIPIGNLTNSSLLIKADAEDFNSLDSLM